MLSCFLHEKKIDPAEQDTQVQAEEEAALSEPHEPEDDEHEDEESEAGQSCKRQRTPSEDKDLFGDRFKFQTPHGTPSLSRRLQLRFVPRWRRHTNCSPSWTRS